MGTKIVLHDKNYYVLASINKVRPKNPLTARDKIRSSKFCWSSGQSLRKPQFYNVALQPRKNLLSSKDLVQFFKKYLQEHFYMTPELKEFVRKYLTWHKVKEIEVYFYQQIVLDNPCG